MIRTATPADIPALCALHAAAFPRGWTTAEFSDFLAQENTHLWVAEAGNTSGFLLIQDSGEEAEIITLVVDGAQRRSGIASALLTHACNALSQKGIHRLFLEVHAGNLPAQQLYLRHGFAEYARRRAYYKNADGTRADAILMQHSLK